MALELRPGDVFDYPYLWAWQAAKGETEGRKERPVCLLVTVAGPSGATMVILAITATEPGPEDDAIEIPAIEARRVGLDSWKRGWVIVSEANFDDPQHSWYLDVTRPARGRFSAAFLSKVSAGFREMLVSRAARTIDRRG